MRQVAINGIAALLLLGGCAHEKPMAPRPAAAPAAPEVPATAPAQNVPGQTAPPQPSTTAAAGSGEPKGATPDRGHAPRAAGGAAGTGNAGARTPGTARAAAPVGGAAGATAGAASRPAPAPTPALDLASLEQRLRETGAIGLFTKLSLKNQVDSLLGEFRAFHRGPHTQTLGDLRQKYDLLLLKVLSLLQDGDPPLAAAISSSREAIWEILIDPQRFDKLARN